MFGITAKTGKLDWVVKVPNKVTIFPVLIANKSNQKQKLNKISPFGLIMDAISFKLEETKLQGGKNSRLDSI